MNKRIVYALTLAVALGITRLAPAMEPDQNRFYDQAAEYPATQDSLTYRISQNAKRLLEIVWVGVGLPHVDEMKSLLPEYIVWHIHDKFFQAFRDNNLPKVQKIIEKYGSQIDARDYEYEMTPLLWAAKRGYTHIAHHLVKAGSDLEAKNMRYQRHYEEPNEGTPLIWAACEGHTVTCKMLLAAGANLSAKDRNGSTALAWAARNGHAKTVELLIAAGAELEAELNSFGYIPDSALVLAASFNHYAICKLLLDAGANPDSAHRLISYYENQDNAAPEAAKYGWNRPNPEISALLKKYQGNPLASNPRLACIKHIRALRNQGHDISIEEIITLFELYARPDSLQRSAAIALANLQIEDRAALIERSLASGNLSIGKLEGLAHAYPTLLHGIEISKK